MAEVAAIAWRESGFDRETPLHEDSETFGGIAAGGSGNAPHAGGAERFVHQPRGFRSLHERRRPRFRGHLQPTGDRRRRGGFPGREDGSHRDESTHGYGKRGYVHGHRRRHYGHRHGWRQPRGR